MAGTQEGMMERKIMKIILLATALCVGYVLMYGYTEPFCTMVGIAAGIFGLCLTAKGMHDARR